MTERLDPKTQEQMRELCRKISVEYDLEAEIQRELLGHMEDKLLAYLAGEEPLTKDDAFVLMREHFGDPAVLKGLLQEVHQFESRITVARRLAALIAASAASMTIGFWVLPDLFGICFAPLYGLLKALMFVNSELILWLVLRHWQRRLDAGCRLWFLAWRPISIVGLLAALTALFPVVSYWTDSMVSQYSFSDWTLTFWQSPRPSLAIALFATCWFLFLVLQCFLWLWWCDRPPRRTGAIGNAAGAWAVYSWILWGSLRWPEADSFVAMPLTTVAESVLSPLGGWTICALVGCLLYASYRRHTRTSQQRYGERLNEILRKTHD